MNQQPGEPRHFTIPAAAAGGRLDVAIALCLPELSRARARQLIDAGLVTLNGLPGKASSKVRAGDKVDLTVTPAPAIRADPEQIPLDIRYQDEDLLVVAKPKGMATHPAAGTLSGTLVNALLGRGGELSPAADRLRPGIVHRLDKDTSGLLVVACNEVAHRALSEQIQKRTMVRTYLAVVHGGVPQDQGTVDAPVGRHPVERKRMAVVTGGRRAVTHWRVRERFQHFTLLEVKLETGRTHQIRVHLRHIGHPVAGDPVYGQRRERLPAPLTSQALHAWRLAFPHPRTGELLSFEVEPPAEFAQLLAALRRRL